MSITTAKCGKLPLEGVGGLRTTHAVLPSGLPWAKNSGDDTELPANANNRKYNGKEWVEMHGLDEYDSEARWYYPAIMRTTTIDPLAEVKPWLSPYMWCSGNPVNRTDPTGMIDDQVLPEVTVTAPKKNKNSNFNYEFQRMLDNANRNKPQIPKITPPTPVFNLPLNSNMFVNLINVDEKKNSTLDDISLALSAIGIAAD